MATQAATSNGKRRIKNRPSDLDLSIFCTVMQLVLCNRQIKVPKRKVRAIAQLRDELINSNVPVQYYD